MNEDEEYRKVDFSKIPSLRPAFKPNNGTVTAANASTLDDGASALLLGGNEYESKAVAKVIAYADAECNPKLFTIAPSLAIPKALKLANLCIADISLFEINEAFSVVALANQKLLSIDNAKLNINGGAVSLGHPVG